MDHSEGDKGFSADGSLRLKVPESDHGAHPASSEVMRQLSVLTPIRRVHRPEFEPQRTEGNCALSSPPGCSRFITSISRQVLSLPPSDHSLSL